MTEPLRQIASYAEYTAYIRIPQSDGQMEKLRVLVADAHTDVRYALQVALPQMKTLALDVVDQVTTIEDLGPHVSALQPDLLLLDWHLPHLAELNLGAVRQMCPQLKIIALGTRAEAGAAALHAGVDAFVNKGDGAECLMQAIRKLFES